MKGEGYKSFNTLCMCVVVSYNYDWVVGINLPSNM